MNTPAWKRIAGKAFYSGGFGRLAAWIGTLFGALLYIVLSGSWLLHLGTIVILVFIGLATASYYDRSIAPHRSKGHEAVMSDETVGFLVTMISFPFTAATPAEAVSSVRYLVIGIALFRAFDSWKPAPVHHIANLPGGRGVLLDDVAAGIYANLILQLIRLDPVSLALS